MKPHTITRLKTLLTTAALLLSAATGSAQKPAGGETVLHNGIVLPGDWPPHYPYPDSRNTMPVPYLLNKPEVIDINVGRQLFVDDFLIASTNMVRTTHTAEMYPGNPVIQGENRWEFKTGKDYKDGVPYADPYSGGVWYDETDGKFKIWLRSGNGDGGDYTAYAESEDGVHWEKPSSDLVPGTSIVICAEHDSQTVWLDKSEKDPSRRFKSIYVDTSDGCKYVLRYSPDGIHWGDEFCSSGPLQDRSTVFYNPFLKKWVASLRIVVMKNHRARAYMENESIEDLVRNARVFQDEIDTLPAASLGVAPCVNNVYWLCSDDKDTPHPFADIAEKTDGPALYNVDANAYESVMIGEFAIWRGPENNQCERRKIQKLNEFCIAFSRDGFHFSRPDHRPFMESVQEEDAWNWGNMQAAAGNPIIVGDSLYFYCGGHRRNDIMWDGWTSTGLTKLRRDGFVSMDAVPEGAYLVTLPVRSDGKYLFVNACASLLSVEVLDVDGNVIKGFSKEKCRVLKNIDSTKAMVTWKGRRDLSSLAGRPVRFRFHLADGSLYAFWVSPWKTGESRGYTGGGGPGLHPSGIDLPVGND
ncbi:MAG: hypothetical protein ACI3ZO_02340 [Candidatus Cryptobacteroides sp.]